MGAVPVVRPPARPVIRTAPQTIATITTIITVTGVTVAFAQLSSVFLLFPVQLLSEVLRVVATAPAVATDRVSL